MVKIFFLRKVKYYEVREYPDNVGQNAYGVMNFFSRFYDGSQDERGGGVRLNKNCRGVANSRGVNFCDLVSLMKKKLD